jgi:tetratricopeptide (TPR) repeat protein
VERIDALNGAVKLALEHGAFALGATYSAEELLLAKELGDPLLIGWGLCNAGLVASRFGELDQAAAFFTEALQVGRAGGHVELEGWANLWVGDMALALAHYKQAAAHYSEALAFFQETNWDWGLVDVNAGLGGVHYRTGDLAAAATHFGESLERAWHVGVPVLGIGPLLGLAGVFAELGAAEQGARLFGAAEGIMASLSAPAFPRDHPARDRALAALTAQLGDDCLNALRESGRALTFEQAVAEARAVTSQVSGSAIDRSAHA